MWPVSSGLFFRADCAMVIFNDLSSYRFNLREFDVIFRFSFERRQWY